MVAARPPHGRTDIPLTDVGRDQAGGSGAVLARASVQPGPVEPARAGGRDRPAGRLRGPALRSSTTSASGTTAPTRGGRASRSPRTIPGWTVWSRPIVGGESLDGLGRAGRPGDRGACCPIGGDVLVFSPRPLPARARRPLDRAAAPGMAAASSSGRRRVRARLGAGSAGDRGLERRASPPAGDRAAGLGVDRPVSR